MNGNRETISHHGHPGPNPDGRGCGGFTLIEVLVAVLVLSIGLLGLAGLQTAGLRNNHSAYLRSQATVLAYDMADRMRANRAGIDNGDYNPSTATQHTTCEQTSGCTSTEMAENDAYQWTQDLTNQLPSGQGVVCEDSSPDDGSDAANAACSGSGDLYAIKVWWRDERDTTTLKRFVVSLRP